MEPGRPFHLTNITLHLPKIAPFPYFCGLTKWQVDKKTQDQINFNVLNIGLCDHHRQGIKVYPNSFFKLLVKFSSKLESMQSSGTGFCTKTDLPFWLQSGHLTCTVLKATRPEVLHPLELLDPGEWFTSQIRPNIRVCKLFSSKINLCTTPVSLYSNFFDDHI